MDTAIPVCPSCSAAHVVRNGANQSGTPTFLCRGCGRRFVGRPEAGPVPGGTRALVLRPLGERMALRAVARAAGVSRSWLQAFVNVTLPMNRGQRESGVSSTGQEKHRWKRSVRSTRRSSSSRR